MSDLKNEFAAQSEMLHDKQLENDRLDELYKRVANQAIVDAAKVVDETNEKLDALQSECGRLRGELQIQEQLVAAETGLRLESERKLEDAFATLKTREEEFSVEKKSLLNYMQSETLESEDKDAELRKMHDQMETLQDEHAKAKKMLKEDIKNLQKEAKAHDKRAKAAEDEMNLIAASAAKRFEELKVEMDHEMSQLEDRHQAKLIDATQSS